MDIRADVTNLCPKRCMDWEETENVLSINNEDCTRCMHCINVMPKALKPGKDRGCSLLIGGKAPILKGARLSSLIIPFVEEKDLQPPYAMISDLMERIWEWWDENGRMRERCGELIDRVGMRVFLKEIGLKPIPQMVSEPRSNPYYFWWPEELVIEPKCEAEENE